MGITINPKRSTGGGGGVTGANSGLILNGTNVQFGNNPLLADAIIDSNGHVYIFFRSTANGTVNTVITDDQAATQMATPNAQGGISGQIGPGDNVVAIMFAGDNLGHAKQLACQINGGGGSILGIEVDDNVDNIGLNAAVVFPKILSTQYMQVADSALLVGTVNQRLIAGVGNNDFTIYTVDPLEDRLLVVSVNAFMSSIGASTVNIELQWTDEGGTVNVLPMATFIGLGNFNITPGTIYAQKGTAVIVRVNINIPGAQVNLYAACQYMQVQNP